MNKRSLEASIKKAKYMRDRRERIKSEGNPDNLKAYSNNERKHFIGVDGEGWDVDDRQQYVLLGASDKSSVYDDKGLPTHTCFDYLIDLKQRNPLGILVGFAFSYDVNMILRDIPRSFLERLHKTGHARWKHKLWTYDITFIRGKWFQVTRYDWTRKIRVKSTFRVYDVFGFFQSRFVRAMLDMQMLSELDDDYAELTAMKDNRGSFTADMRDRVEKYNLKETTYLAAAMEKLRSGLNDVGLTVSSWHGAGAIAGALLKKHGVKEHMGETPAHIKDVALHAYFGADIRVIRIGRFPTVHKYDIVSAYPAKMPELPCLMGSWKPVDYLPNHDNAMLHVKWSIPFLSRIPPFPVRDRQHRIAYPTSGEGWYWACEVRAAMNRWGDSIKILNGWEFVSDDPECKPLAWVRDIFAQRKKLKAAGLVAQQHAIKLGINSIYGKVAQGVGWKGAIPAFQNYMWAGMITAHTRAKLLEIAYRDEDGPIAFMTDALWTEKELPCDMGDNLGQWEHIAAEDLFILQPGVYRYWGNDNKYHYASRGFKVEELPWDDLASRLKVEGFKLRYDMEVTRFFGLGTSLQRRDFDLWRRWVKIPMTIRPVRPDVNVTISAAMGKRTIEYERGNYVWQPQRFNKGEMSEKYTPRGKIYELDDKDAITLMELEESLSLEQPDMLTDNEEMGVFNVAK